MRSLRFMLLGSVVLGAFFSFPQAAGAGDVTVFTARSLPSDQWGGGYGAALSSTWFRFATFEAEVARTTGDAPDSGMTSFTGSALLSVPLAFVTPYGGVGVGLFRQTTGADSDVGNLKAFILGAKVRIGGVLVIRGDYRKLSLSGPPIIPMDQRLAAGVGITF
jgi:hypothetical protein